MNEDTLPSLFEVLTAGTKPFAVRAKSAKHACRRSPKAPRWHGLTVGQSLPKRSDPPRRGLNCLNDEWQACVPSSARLILVQLASFLAQVRLSRVVKFRCFIRSCERNGYGSLGYAKRIRQAFCRPPVLTRGTVCDQGPRQKSSYHPLSAACLSLRCNIRHKY